MHREPKGLRALAGRLVGAAAAPPVGAISAVRHARMFHPRGSVFSGRLDPIAGRHHDVARRLAGRALVRMSGALSKREAQRFEVLGVAVRISSAPIHFAEPRDGDQDLLFATIVSPLTMPLAPFTTRSGDFFANCYYGVAPFFVEGIGRVKLRLSPVFAPPHARGARADALARAVDEGRAAFVLEVRRTLRTTWIPIATLVLDAPSDVDQEALRFDPFRDGRGISPVGLVHAMRKATYAASQSARP